MKQSQSLNKTTGVNLKEVFEDQIQEIDLTQKKVGVLLPFFHNNGEYTEDILDSLRRQTYGNVELYALHDGLIIKDPYNVSEAEYYYNEYMETVKYGIEDYFQGPHFIILPYNIGAFRSYNLLAAFAWSDKCDYIIPVGQDDTLEPTCIEEMVNLLEKHDYDWVNVAAQQFGDGHQVMMPIENATYEQAWRENPLTSFGLFKMDVWNEYGGYDTSITPSDLKVGIEDCELWLRLLRDKRKYGVVKKPLYNYRIHKDQAHTMPAKYGLELLYKIIAEKHGYKRN